MSQYGNFSLISASGERLHLLTSDVVTSHDGLAQYLITHEITSAYIPPPLLTSTIDRTGTMHTRLHRPRSPPSWSRTDSPETAAAL